MKSHLALIPILIIILIISGNCTGKGTSGKKEAGDYDTLSVPDTGYTGIKQYYSKNTLTYEVTFKNSVRHGLMKTFYPDGKLRQTFWYENGMKEDTAIWFYEDGKIFRKTAFKRDSMNGMQIQYYKSGKVKAKLEFENGLRKPYLEEFTMDGKKVTDYPSVIINTTDNYAQNGSYIISVGLSKKDIKANFYQGDYIDGLFAPKKLKKINSSESTGFIKLQKSGSPGQNYVGIIAEISTAMGNKLLVYNKVELPYNDLK
jgi:hypothetical protein